ncbi:MAG: saccharopine dehydrogenase family protein [Janthinobacterium lividum]
MRILALGGCGQEGKKAVGEMVKLPDLTELVIADLNGEKALQHAQLHGARARGLQLDVMDRPRLLEQMRQADVVVSFVGPYYRFGQHVLTAAIEAQRNFVDICDDPDATVMELELDDACQTAGISALIGMGCSPGSFNVVAAYGAQYLDVVHDIELEWCVSVNDIEDTGTSAAMPHVFHIIDGEHQQFLNGKLTNVASMSGRKTVSFPLFGELETYFVGHPEPITLPRYFKDLRTATNRGCLPGIDDLLRSFQQAGMTSDVPVGVAGAQVRPRDLAGVLLANAPLSPAAASLPPNCGGRIIVRGLKDGRVEERQYLITAPLNMSPNTGCAAAVGVAMMGRGQITRKGAFAPEGGVDPNIFMMEMSKIGFTWEETIIRTGSLVI